MMIFVLLLATFAADDDIPPSALFAQFRENRARFPTLTVQWKRDHRVTDDGILFEQKRLDAIDAKIEAMGDLESLEAKQLYQNLQARKQAALAKQQSNATMFQTFLANGDKFMMRIAPPTWGVTHADDDWLMPSVPVTSESMMRDFNGFILTAFADGPEPMFRVWNISGNYGQVYHQMQGNEGTYHFPPLGVPGKIGTPAYWHPIDKFFTEDPSTYRTTGKATIGGHDVIVIEKQIAKNIDAAIVASKEEQAHGTRLRAVDVVRASIDPNRGGLPVKIEWFAETLCDGKPLPRPKGWRADRVLEVTEIVEIPGGGFYPTRGTDQTFGDDPNHKGPGNTIDGLIAGTLVEIPSVVIEETTWHAAKVVATATLAETFALPFPENAYYYNEVTGYSGRVGDEFRNGTRLPWMMCGVIAAGWVIYAVIAVLIRLVRPPVQSSPA